MSGAATIDRDIAGAQTLVEVLEVRARCAPGRVAARFLDSDLGTCGELSNGRWDREARSLAAFLARDVERGARVLLWLPPGLEFDVALMGCWYGGFVAVPVQAARRSQARLSALCDHSGSSVVIAMDRDVSRLRSVLANRVRVVGHGECRPTAPSATAAPPSPDDLAVIQYTSGSTSRPRGVMVTHRNLLANSAMIQRAIASGPSSVILSWLPHFHDMGLVFGILQPLFAGAVGVRMSPGDFARRPARWIEAASRYRATVAIAPNFAYETCANLPRDTFGELDLSSLHVAISASEALREETVARFRTRFAPAGLAPGALIGAYGLAEATLAVTGGRLQTVPRVVAVDRERLGQGIVAAVRGGAPSATFVSSGAPLCSAEVAIVDPDSCEPCPPARVGEIWVRGPSVARGYWADPEATARTFGASVASGDAGYLRTGDLGFLSDGELIVSGRRKELIVIRGRNFYPTDIERTVDACHPPGLARGAGVAFSTGLDGRDGVEELVVVWEVERSARRDARVTDVAAAVRSAVAAEFEVGVAVVVLVPPGGIPRTTSGKLQRCACAELFESGDLRELGRSRERMLAQPADARRSASATRPESADVIAAAVARVLGVDAAAVDRAAQFSGLGLDSLAMARLAEEIEQALGVPVGAADLYSFPTIRALAAALGDAAPKAGDRARAGAQEPIAIIGMGCRFPAASSPAELWELIASGREAIREVPGDRWSVERFYDADPGTPGKTYSKWGGFLDDVDRFDADFFGISPREAANMDPQQRLLLEVSWHALEDARLDPLGLAGSATGTYVGIGSIDYTQLAFLLGARVDAYLATGTTQSIAANRLSYFYDFRGPSLAIDTACSSSLVALHSACDALRSGEASLALACGVNALLSPYPMVALSQARMLSPHGQCKAFAADADGYVRSEGCGVVVLKRLRDALRDGDRVRAVVRGIATRHNGRSNGLTAPTAVRQAETIRAALDAAGVLPTEVSYVEAHGTGTRLGDPIEFEALRGVYGEGRDELDSLPVGSVKTNIGHLEAAAGMAGLIKVVLALEAEQLPPQRFSGEPNPLLALGSAPLHVSAEGAPWPRGARRRLAGVSAFGYGGANAHVIVEEAPMSSSSRVRAVGPAHSSVLVLSAKNDPALRRLSKLYADVLRDSPAATPRAVAAAATRKSHFEQRLAVVCRPEDDPNEASRIATALETFAAGGEDAAIVRGAASAPVRVGFLFSGQGTHHWGMGRELYERESAFRSHLGLCNEILAELGVPLLDVLYGEAGGAELERTELAQPVLFALQVSLAHLWRSVGVAPDLVLGHSVGELAAACVAGACGLEDGLRFSVERGRCMERECQPGGMFGVVGPRTLVERVLSTVSGEVEIAAFNASNLHTISGSLPAIELAARALSEAGATVRRLPVARAFHSRMMAPIVERLRRVAAQVAWRSLEVPLISSHLATLLPAGTELDAGRWADHARDPVRFDESIDVLAGQALSHLVEIGPDRTLLDLVRRSDGARSMARLASLRVREPAGGAFRASVARLYVDGQDLAWEPLHPDPVTEVELPPYPFERARFWVKAGEVATAQDELASPAEAPPPATARALYVQEWSPSDRDDGASQRTASEVAWLVVDGGVSFAGPLVEELRRRGVRCRYASAASLEGALAELSGTESRVVVCPGEPAACSRSVDRALEACAQVSDMLRAVLRASDARQMSLVFATRGAQRTPVDPTVAQVDMSAIWGLVKTAMLEQPEIVRKIVDVAADGGDAAALADELVADTEPLVALRPGGARYVARLVPVDAPTKRAFACRRDGTYLVTGAFGGLGVSLTRWLAERGARRLLLLGRSMLPAREDWTRANLPRAIAERIRVVRELEAQGVAVHTAAVDLAEPGELERVLRGFEDERWPPICGVFHLAGELDDRALQNLDGAAFERVFAAKARGAQALLRFFDGAALDFLVFFSSAASLLGSMGQGNYAAANAYLDGLAGSGGAVPCRSIQWGPWALGMAARTGRRSDSAAVVRPLSEADALARLEIALGSESSVVGALDLDVAGLGEILPPAARAFVSSLGVERVERRSSDEADRIAHASARERPALLLSYLCDRVASILESPRESVSSRADLVSLGLDSIMIMDLARVVDRDLDLRMNPREVFECESLEALAQYIAIELDIQAGRRTGEAPPSEGFVSGIYARGQERLEGEFWPELERKNPPVIFVLSSPRAGSTLLRAMLAGHPDLFSPPELHLLPFPDMRDRARILPDLLKLGLVRALSEAAGICIEAADERIRELERGLAPTHQVYAEIQALAAPRILVDKSPPNALDVEILARAEHLFESPRYVFLVRHPYAVIESYVRNRTGRMFLEGVRDADSYALAEEIWARSNENILRLRDTVASDRFCTVRYEELVADAPRVLRGLCDALEIPFDEALLEPHATGRMTDGGYATGDPNFHRRLAVDPELADRWRSARLPRELGARAREVALALEYALPPASSPEQPSSLLAGSPLAFQDERL